MPSDAENCTLTTFLDTTVNCGTIGMISGTDAGGKMKSVSRLWASPNTGATNSSGFSALPAGYRSTNGSNAIGSYSLIWSSSEYSATNAILRLLDFNNSNILRGSNPKNDGFSARCLKD